VFYKSYAALLGELSLVGGDGRASMCYTPDVLSNHYGFNAFSGDVGLGMFGDLRGASAYLIELFPRPRTIQFGFGCVVERTNKDETLITINDGVGMRFLFPAKEFKLELDRGRIETVRLSRTFESLGFTWSNPISKSIKVHPSIHGLWGKNFNIEVNGKKSRRSTKDGYLTFPALVAADGSTEVKISVVK